MIQVPQRLSDASQKAKLVNNGFAVIKEPGLSDLISHGIRPEVAQSSMISLKSVFPVPLAIDDKKDIDNSTGPLRVVLSGSASAAALDYFLLQNEWAIMPVPAKAAAYRAGVAPETARHALSSFMRCYPFPILFTGGSSYDHEWLIARRAVILQVEDNFDIHVRASSKLSDPYWMDHSTGNFERKLHKALTVVKMITRDFSAHQVPKEYSSMS